MLIERESFINWVQNPVTQQIMGLLQEDREYYLQCLASEDHLVNPMYSQLAAKWGGMISIIDKILNIKHVDVSDEEVL